MLLLLRDFIQRERVVSAQQLQREFSLDEEALQPMLALWINKGVIEICPESLSCGKSCGGCSSAPPRYYRFV